MSAARDGFIQVIEVWRPHADGLRYAGGVYGRHAELGRLSAVARFRKGEGLPGSVWSTGRAAIWHPLDEAFLRTHSAQVAGFQAALAFPVFHGEICVAVVVMLCGGGAHTSGCIELWQPNGLRELAHAGGYYGGLAAFESLSRLMRFQPGRGLPGITWERGLPHIIEDTRASNSFLRAAAARECGVEAGIGIPLHENGELAQILVLLSAQSTPLARAFEVWTCDESRGLSRAESFYGPGLEAVQQSAEEALAPAAGVLGRAALSGVPYAFSAADGDSPFAGRDAARAAGIQGGIAIPIYTNGAVRALVMLLI